MPTKRNSEYTSRCAMPTLPTLTTLENGHTLPCGVGIAPFFFSRRSRLMAPKGPHGCLTPPTLLLIPKKLDD